VDDVVWQRQCVDDDVNDDHGDDHGDVDLGDDVSAMSEQQVYRRWRAACYLFLGSLPFLRTTFKYIIVFLHKVDRRGKARIHGLVNHLQ
jgi:hypothetical protein